MNRILHGLSTAITLAALIGLLVFVLAPASIFLAFYFLVEAGRSLLASCHFEAKGREILLK